MPGGGFDGEILAVVKRFDTLWLAGPYLAVPVAYPGVTFAKPSEGSTWVQLELLGGFESAPAGIDSANTPVNHNGIISVIIYTPIDEGTKEAREIAHWIAVNVFGRKQFSEGNSGTITTRESSIVNSRASDEHERYRQTTLDTRYERRT